MKQNILIAGGSGFVGTNLINALKKNDKFKIYSNYFKNKNLDSVTDVEFKKANLENLDDCIELCKDKNIVVMCAANSSGAAVMEKTPLVHLSPNIRMNINMLEASYQCGVKKFIFISSNTVYPHVEFPVKEEDASFDFFEKYYVVGWMKRFSEVVTEIYSKKIKNNSMKTIIIRPGNLYGPYDKFDPEKSKVIPSLIRKVVQKNNPLQVWGDGKDLKDFLYIDDFIDALIEIINNIESFETINIASGKGITIREILSLILKIEKAEHFKVNYDLSMPTMIPKRLINIDKAKNLINFNPKVDIYEGLKRTIDWYKNINDYN